MQIYHLFTSLVSLIGCSSALPISIPKSSKDSAVFGLVSVPSGGPLHLTTIKYDYNHPQVFSIGTSENDCALFALNKDTTLTEQTTGRGVYFDSKTGEIGLVSHLGNQAATSGFSIDNDILSKGKEGFVACPTGDNEYSLTFNSKCIGGISIELLVASH